MYLYVFFAIALTSLLYYSLNILSRYVSLLIKKNRLYSLFIVLS
nr:MAG TPA: hypothetical protein [Bacteriophage sp.]